MPDFGKDKDGKTRLPTSAADRRRLSAGADGLEADARDAEFHGTQSPARDGAGARVGVNVDVHGGGYVVAQEPAAGAPLNHATVKLTLAPIVADSGAETAAESGIVPASYFSGGGDRPSGESETW